MQKEFTVKDQFNLLNYAFLFQHNKKNLENIEKNCSEYRRLEDYVAQDRERLYLTWFNLSVDDKIKFCKTLAGLHNDKQDVFRTNVSNNEIIDCFEELFASLEGSYFWKQYQKIVSKETRNYTRNQPNGSLINRIRASRKALAIMNSLIDAQKQVEQSKNLEGRDEIERLVSLSKAEDRYYSLCYEFINHFKAMNEMQKKRFYTITENYGGQFLLMFAKKLTDKTHMDSLIQERKHFQSVDTFEKYLTRE